MKKLTNRIKRNNVNTLSQLRFDADAAMAIETFFLMNFYYYAGADLVTALHLGFVVAIILKIAKTPYIKEKKIKHLSRMYAES